MALPLIIADWETSLAAKIAVGGTTGTLIGNTDDDGVTIADGLVFLTLDGNNSAKEHIKATKTGTALSDIYSVSRQGVETSGTVREHRVGAKVIMTDYATYKNYFVAASGLTGPGSSTDGNVVLWDGVGGNVLKDGGAPVTPTSTVTLTNKRITPRITTITSHATPTINTDDCDMVTITAQAEAITSMTTSLSGTPTNFQKLIIRIKDNGTAQAITWGASFEAKGASLPTTTVISKVLTVGFIYDTVTSKWGCVASVYES
jgi:hypothetical protein